MLKLFPIILATATLTLLPMESMQSAIARVCVNERNCSPIKFIPGQTISVEVVNLTRSVVEMQQVNATEPIVLSPGQELLLRGRGGTEPNFSGVFWEVNGVPLRLQLRQPNPRLLRIEMRYGSYPPGDSAVYIQDDGYVNVF